MELWLQNNFMFFFISSISVSKNFRSTLNEGKPAAAEKFIRILKNNT